MIVKFTKLSELNQRVFRNIRGMTNLDFDEFDDLTHDPEARAWAHRTTSTYSIDKSQFAAVDYIFAQKSWELSRFGNGEFPVWYSSLDLKTSFYETIYHWRKKFIEAPKDFTQTSQWAQRSVFTVICKAALIDLREYAEKISHPDPGFYSDTQQVGLSMHQQGYPGLITKSARYHKGENVAIFRKEILFDPEYYSNYIYEYNSSNKEVIVKDWDGILIKLD